MFQILAVSLTNDPWNVLVLHYLVLNTIVSGFLLALVILLLPSLCSGIISSLTHTILLITLNWWSEEPKVRSYYSGTKIPLFVGFVSQVTIFWPCPRVCSLFSKSPQMLNLHSLIRMRECCTLIESFRHIEINYFSLLPESNNEPV